jgi:GNAT superfamily N-acetyltransferase
MPDILVKLYELPDDTETVAALRTAGINIRNAMPYEKGQVLDWVSANFGREWASEADVAFSAKPVSCIIATEAGAIVGFACYEATCRGYFGPTGVVAEKRGMGIGKALLIAAMRGLADMGYAYAVIGAAGPVEFYTRTLGAIPIPGSSPGIYRDRLKKTVLPPAATP